MPRVVTDNEKRARRSSGSLLDELLIENNISLRALDAAFNGAGDRRGMLREIRRRQRTMTADSAIAIGDAVHKVGLPWMNGGVMLYAAGHFAEWIRYLNCLREQSYPAALVSAFVTHSLGDQVQRAFGRPAINGPGPSDALYRALLVEAPRSALSRFDDAWLRLATASWQRGEHVSAAVRAANALDQANAVDFQIRNSVALSLAINVISRPKNVSDCDAQEVTKALYEGYHRRLPLLHRQEWLTHEQRIIRWDLNVHELDAILDRYLPAPRYPVDQ